MALSLSRSSAYLRPLVVTMSRRVLQLSLLVLVLVASSNHALQTPFVSRTNTGVSHHGVRQGTALHLEPCDANNNGNNNNDDAYDAMDDIHKNKDRRSFLSQLALSSIVTTMTLSSSLQPAFAAEPTKDQDLTSQLFNADGSPKEGIATEAKETVVDIFWTDSDQLQLNIDGLDTKGTESGKSVKVSYKLPDKWGTGSDLYLDRSEGVNEKACDRIIVYRAPGTYQQNRLDKATTMGVGKALSVVDQLDKVSTSDIIGGRKIVKGENEQVYYEFDLAVAPETCGQSSANLGLGFCPYDTIFLLSATVTEDGKLYVMGVESNYREWKQANADLKRVRSSFVVTALTTGE